MSMGAGSVSATRGDAAPPLGFTGDPVRALARLAARVAHERRNPLAVSRPVGA